jgi:hypothetical protein
MSVSFVRELQTLFGLTITDNGMSAVSASRTERQTQRQRRMKMSNIYTIHPPKSDLINFYEILEPNGSARWGGGDAKSAIQWLYLAPVGSRVLVSAWESDEEDAHLVGQSIDITELIQQAREVGL